MKSKYRYRFPISMSGWRWGFSISLQRPIVKIITARPTDPEDSMLIYIGMFDEDPQNPTR